MDLTLGSVELEAVQKQAAEAATAELAALQVMLIGGGNVTVFVG
jgi:hypothetical protein